MFTKLIRVAKTTPVDPNKDAESGIPMFPERVWTPSSLVSWETWPLIDDNPWAGGVLDDAFYAIRVSMTNERFFPVGSYEKNWAPDPP